MNAIMKYSLLSSIISVALAVFMTVASAQQGGRGGEGGFGSTGEGYDNGKLDRIPAAQMDKLHRQWKNKKKKQVRKKRRTNTTTVRTKKKRRTTNTARVKKKGRKPKKTQVARRQTRLAAIPLPRPRPDFTLAQAGSGLPPAGETRFVPDEVIIIYQDGQTPQTIAAFEQSQALQSLASRTIALIGADLYRYRIIDGRTVRQVIAAAEQIPTVSAVQPNYLYTLQDQSAAAAPSPQYALDRMNLLPAHDLARGDKVRVAVIDSAVDIDHAELAGSVTNRLDTLEMDGSEPHNHGTAIAGVIAAHGSLLGVAPSATILAVRAFAPNPNGGTAQGTTFNVITGLDWAVGEQARIVNMSFAGPRDPFLSRAMKAARDRHVILVGAAGNAGPKSPPLHPAADPSVLSVTATDHRDGLFQAANRGRHIAIAAPGVKILSPAANNSYQTPSGTSLAAAHISGLVALLLERDPNINARSSDADPP